MCFSFSRVVTAWSLLGLLGLILAGCDSDTRSQSSLASQQPVKQPQTGKTPNPSASDEPKAGQASPALDDYRKGATELSKNVWFSVQGGKRRVLVGATVCLREGSYGLECLLCRNQTKEHESILTTDADAKFIHAALIAAGAEPGAPVQYLEKNGEVVVVPPKGSRIKIALQYEHQGKRLTVPAQQWVRNSKTGKALEEEWVFAGSQLWPDQEDPQKPPVYGASADGAYICISNVPSAMLDLPINSPKGLDDRVYEPYTERIPALDTKILLVLEPEGEAKK
jgi:hypothetical protein